MKKVEKKLSIIVILILILSIALNLVLFKNVKSVEADTESKYQKELSDKDKQLAGFEAKIEELNTIVTENNATEDGQKKDSEMKMLNEYKEIADQFIHDYLTYNTESLLDRREKLKDITDEKLIDRIAPEPQEQEGKVYSSDPTFTSKVTKTSVFVSNDTDLNETANVIVDVEYDTKSTEGEAPLRSLVYLKMERDEGGKIKVMSYDYHQI